MTQTIELDAIFPAQDYILIGGDKSPGKARIVSANSPRPWDIRKGYGLSGASVIPQGDDLSKFSVIFEFWEPAQIPAWYAFAAKYFDKSVRYMPGSNKPRALGIQHPILAAPPIRITEVVVTDASSLEADEYGLWSCKIDFLQYRQPQAAPDPPEDAIPAAANPQPTAQDAADQMTQQKRVDVAGLARPPT